MAHPNSLKNLKPFEKGNKKNNNSGRILIDKFHQYMNGLEAGAYPWEIIQDVITSPETPQPDKVKGAAILGNWIIKDTPATIEVNAETAIINDVESRIRDLLKSQDEAEEEEAEEAINDETDE